MYLVEREVDELQVLLVDKRVVGQGDQLVVTQVEFKQIDKTLKHEGSHSIAVPVVGDDGEHRGS